MSAKNIGRNKNESDEADVPTGFTVTATTSLKIADANPDRIFFRVDNNEMNKDVWVKLQPAADDNDKKGFLLKGDKGESSWEMPPDNIYTGEISAIANLITSVVTVTEY